MPSLSPPCPAFSFDSAPYPPDPLPLRGRGRPRLFHARGFAPCIPGLNPSGTGSRGEPLARRGACPTGRRLVLPPLYPAGSVLALSPPCPAFSFDSAPYPPDPLPLRGRGRPRLFHARGFAPCIPGLNPSGTGSRGEPLARRGRARLVGGWSCRRCTRRGACLLCRLPAPPLACFPAPYPPARARRALFPSGEGGDPKFILPGATAPGTPTFNRLRHLQNLPSRYPAGGFASCKAGLRWRSDTRRGCGG